MPLTDPERLRLQQLVESISRPGGKPLDAYARGELRAWLSRAEGPDIERLRVLLDGRADAPAAAQPPPDDPYTRGAVRAAATNRQENPR